MYKDLVKEGKKLVENYKRTRYELGKLTTQAIKLGKSIPEYARDISISPHTLQDVHFEYTLSTQIEDKGENKLNIMKRLAFLKHIGEVNKSMEKKDLNNVYNIYKNSSEERQKFLRYKSQINSMLGFLANETISDLTESDIDETITRIDGIRKQLENYKQYKKVE